jgi:hypothetical protein
MHLRAEVICTSFSPVSSLLFMTPTCLLSVKLSVENIVTVSHVSRICDVPTHILLLDLITLIIKVKPFFSLNIFFSFSHLVLFLPRRSNCSCLRFVFQHSEFSPQDDSHKYISCRCLLMLCESAVPIPRPLVKFLSF